MPRPLRISLLGAAVLLAALTVRGDQVPADARARHADMVIRQTKDPTPQRVALTLREAGPAAIGLAMRLLDDRRAAVRAGAAAYLGLCRSRLGVPGLIRRLRDPSAGARRSAAAALGLIGDPRARHFLRRALTARDPSVAEAARVALERIQARQMGGRH
jgi:HEAT repeat protein